MKRWTKQVNEKYFYGGRIVFPYIIPLVVVGFLSGLLAFYYFSFNFLIIVLFLVWLVGFWLIGFFLKYRFIFWLAIFLIFFTIGLGRGFIFEAGIRDSFLEGFLEQKISLSGQVISSPECQNFYCRFVFQPTNSQAKVLVSTRGENVDFSCGQYLEINGKLARPQAFIDEQGKLFAYDRYLAGRKIAYTISFATFEKSEQESWHYCSWLSSLKESLLAGPKRYLPEPHYSYFAGMSSGDRLPEKNRQIASQVGLAHLFVVSGYHLQIIATALFSLFYFLKPTFRLLSTSGIIFLFIALTGFKFSAWRAGLMAVLAGILFIFGRPKKSFYILLAVLLFLSFLSPPALLYDRGFQLSFLAATGLVLLGDFWKRKIDFLPDNFNFKDNTAAFLAVYSIIFPALLLFFGGVSIWSWPANIAVVPLAPLIIFFGFLTGLIYIIPPNFLGQWLAFIPAVISYFLLSVVVQLVNLFYFLTNYQNSQWNIFSSLLLLIIVIMVIRKRLNLSTIIIKGKKCYNKKL
ncbi:MAG TPA: ComEC family competence protein [Candidatus Vogelbacteria bacterium]|nr:ComEC family competence protein [Candidatus Vogelbacteria bacterium]